MTMRAWMGCLLCVSACGETHDPTDAGGDATIAIDGGTDATPGRDATSGMDAGEGCLAGETYYYPGCGASSGETVIEEGCYQPCEGEGDSSCGAGLVCRRSEVNPCVCPAGEGCCAACGAEQWLCRPAAPSGGACGDRGYCDCNGGCEPLIDLSTGCLCECTEPFFCGGPPCACVCGGATYLGCAGAGVCTETMVTCDPGCSLTRGPDGCPSCVC